ncbi:MAG TPA: hypothetical protein VKB95_09560 [Chitinophagaceae bacterium]|nr:hypothetical protein [Chitinophagaceae bacterium]
MKLLIAFVFIFLSVNLFSQDCSNYYYLQNNKTIEMTITNNKGTASGKMIYVVSDSKKNGNAVTATVNSEFVGSNGKTIKKGTNDVKCENGVMQMNMKVFIPPAQSEQMKTGTATTTDVYLDYPANMNVGDQLKDGQLNMDYESTSGLKSSIEINITERKVEGRERVTTPAGTWECYKISAKNKITSKISGIDIPIRMDVTEWFAPGFGVVKTESKTGKTEITSIK